MNRFNQQLKTIFEMGGKAGFASAPFKSCPYEGTGPFNRKRRYFWELGWRSAKAGNFLEQRRKTFTMLD